MELLLEEKVSSGVFDAKWLKNKLSFILANCDGNV